MRRMAKLLNETAKYFFWFNRMFNLHGVTQIFNNPK